MCGGGTHDTYETILEYFYPWANVKISYLSMISHAGEVLATFQYLLCLLTVSSLTDCTRQTQFYDAADGRVASNSVTVILSTTQ